MAKPNDTVTTEPSIALTLNITEKRISDLLCCAFEGGIGYWAAIVGYKMNGKITDKGIPRYPYLTLPLMQGGAVIIADRETLPRGEKIPKSVERWSLDRETILKGFVVMARDYAVHFGNFLAENDDAETGDVFVQCCLFGKLVYG